MSILLTFVCSACLREITEIEVQAGERSVIYYNVNHDLKEHFFRRPLFCGIRRRHYVETIPVYELAELA